MHGKGPWLACLSCSLFWLLGRGAAAAGLPLADDARRRGMHTPAAVTARGEQMGGAGDGRHSSGSGGRLHGEDLGLPQLVWAAACWAAGVADAAPPPRYAHLRGKSPAVSQRGGGDGGQRALDRAQRRAARAPRRLLAEDACQKWGQTWAIWAEITSARMAAEPRGLSAPARASALAGRRAALRAATRACQGAGLS